MSETKRYAVITAGNTPNPKGLPNNWIADIKELRELDPVPNGYTEMTLGEIEAHEDLYLSEYEAWANLGYKLDIAKETKIGDINKNTRELILAGIDYNNVHFDTSLEDQTNYEALVNPTFTPQLLFSGEDRVTIDGKDVNGNIAFFYPDSFAELATFVGNILTFIKSIKTSGMMLKSQVENAATISEVEAIEDNRV